MSDDTYTVKEILARVEGKVDKILDDHENRIRTLEQIKSKWLGAIGAVCGIAAIVANFFPFH